MKNIFNVIFASMVTVFAATSLACQFSVDFEASSYKSYSMETITSFAGLIGGNEKYTYNDDGSITVENREFSYSIGAKYDSSWKVTIRKSGDEYIATEAEYTVDGQDKSSELGTVIKESDYETLYENANRNFTEYTFSEDGSWEMTLPNYHDTDDEDPDLPSEGLKYTGTYTVNTKKRTLTLTDSSGKAFGSFTYSKDGSTLTFEEKEDSSFTVKTTLKKKAQISAE